MVDIINKYLGEILSSSQYKYKIGQLVFVNVGFKKKKLCAERVYINMNGNGKQKVPFPMSMLSLLSNGEEHEKNKGIKVQGENDNNFYLYYTTVPVTQIAEDDKVIIDSDERSCIKAAVQKYFKKDILMCEK